MENKRKAKYRIKKYTWKQKYLHYMEYLKKYKGLISYHVTFNGQVDESVFKELYRIEKELSSNKIKPKYQVITDL